jgi:HSP20 family protein
MEIGSPASLLTNMWDDLEHAYMPFYRMTSGASSPSKIAFDVKESEKSFEVLADVPGIRKEDIDVSIRDHILTLKAERRREDIQEGDNFRRVERYRGWMSRSMHLPDNAAETNIKAEYKDGVLTMIIPKIEVKKGNVIPITIS